MSRTDQASAGREPRVSRGWAPLGWRRGSSPVRDGRAWFGGRIPLPLNPNLGTISTMPPEGYKPSHPGAYGGDFDQKDAGQGSRVYLPVLVVRLGEHPRRQAGQPWLRCSGHLSSPA